MAHSLPTADELRPIKEQAVNFINFAREQNTRSLIATVVVDSGHEVRYEVDRNVERIPVTSTYTDQDGSESEVVGDMETRVTEHVIVKRGRSSTQVILFAGPAAWLGA